MARRQYGTGSITQRHGPDCPPADPDTDERPGHKCRGLWVGRFYAGWDEQGKRRRIQVTAKSEAEAKRRLRDAMRKVATGGPAAVTGRTTVQAWSQTWLAEQVKHQRPKTYATDASAVRKWIVPTIGTRRLADLTPGDVRAVVAAVRDAGRSSTTAHYVQGALARMLRAAKAEGHAVPDVVFAVKPPRPAANDREAIPLEHAARMLEAASREPDGSRWVAAFLQGMRQGECLGLTWDRVNLSDATLDISWQLQALPYLDRGAGTYRIPDGYEAHQLRGAHHLVRPKTRAGYRVIPLVPWMTAALTAWREQAPANGWDLVWPGALAGQPVPKTDKADRAAWYALQDAAQVAKPNGKRYVLHEARHTTATLLLEGGVSEQVTMRILGHSSAAVSRGYQHASTALARQALEAVSARLGLG